jgi:hypothetical protein
MLCCISPPVGDETYKVKVDCPGSLSDKEEAESTAPIHRYEQSMYVFR